MPRTARLLAAIGASSLAVGLLAAIFATPSSGAPSAAADGYSASAIGHRAFVGLLRELGFGVTLRRSVDPAPDDAGTLLIVAEPNLAEAEDRKDRLVELLDQARTVLIVLPKWRPVEDDAHPGWITDAVPVAESELRDVLNAVGVSGRIVRGHEPAVHWVASGNLPEPTLRWPQLVSAEDLRPLVDSEQGTLLGELPRDPQHPERRRLLLSDPDVIETHGLGRGANADFAAGLVESLAGPRGSVSLDETLHGHFLERSVWRELARFPLVLVVLQAALAAGVLLWATLGRFGPIERPRPVFVPGTDALLDSTADLLFHARHERWSLRRFLDDTLHAVGERLRVPAARGAAERRDVLERLGAARGVATGPAALAAAVELVVREDRPEAREILAVAADIHHWREDMLRGTR